MKKRLLTVVLAVIAILSCAMIFACGERPDDSTSDSAGSSQGEIPKQEVVVTLDKKDLVVDLYDEAELLVVVKNSDEDVVWTSDNPAVATVADGVVKGVVEGSTIVRATVEDKTAVCNVTVVKSAELPVLRTEYSEMNLYTGDVFDFEVYTKWKNKNIEAVYDWAVKSGSDVVSVESGDENGKFTLTALKAGVAEYTVSATAVGSTVYADVKFNVSTPDFTLEITNFEKTETGYEYTLWRPVGEEFSVTAETVVKRVGKEIEYAQIAWESADTNIATVENGVITGKADGKTVITATVSGKGIETFETKIQLTVKQEIYRTVTYYDADKTTKLYEETVLNETAAKYVNTTYPDTVLDLGDGYVGVYNSCEWVNADGQDASATLGEVTADMTVYAAYGYVAYKHYEAPKPQDDNTAINGAFASHNKFAKIENNKLVMMFRAYEDNTQVAFMELVNWSTPLTFECKKDVWYTYVVEFAENKPGEDGSAPAHKYYGVKAYILDEAGKVVAQGDAGTINLFDERMWAFAKTPYTVDDNGNKVYGSVCKIDIGVPVAGTKSTIVWKNYNGEVVRTDVGLEFGAEITAPENSAKAGYTFSWGEVPATASGNATYTETRTLNTYKVTVKYVDTDTNEEYQTAEEVEFTVENRAEKLAYVKALLTESSAQYAYAWKDGEPVELALENYEIQINRSSKDHTVTYYDQQGNVLETETVKHGQKATYVYEVTEADVVLGSGYTFAYFDYKWVNEQNGETEVLLTSVTEDKIVYLRKQYITYSRGETYDSNTGYKTINSFNKYVLPDSNGNIEFKIRLIDLPQGGTSFNLHEKQTWTNGNFGQWVSGQEWWTVKGVAATKTVTVYNEKGEATNSGVFENYNAETLSLVLNCAAEIAVVNWDAKDIYTVTYFDLDRTTVLYTEKLFGGDSAVYEYTLEDEEFADGYSKTYSNLHWVDADDKEVSLNNVTDDISVYAKYDVMVYSSYTNSSGNRYVMFKDQNKFAAANDGIMTLYLRISGYTSFAFNSNGKEWAQWVDYINQWYKVELDFNNKTIKYYFPNGSAANSYQDFEATLDNLNFAYRDGVTTDIGVMNPDMVKVTYMDGETELATEYVLKGQAATKKASKSGNNVKVFDHFEDASGNTVSLENVTEDTTVQVIYNVYTSRKINLSTYEGDESIFTITESTTELADSDICSKSQVITSTQNASKWLLTDVNFGEYDYCFLYIKVSVAWQNVPKLTNGVTDYSGNIYDSWVKIEFIKNTDGTYNVVCSDGTINNNVAAGKADIFVWNGGSVYDHTIVISELFYANK